MVLLVFKPYIVAFAGAMD